MPSKDERLGSRNDRTLFSVRTRPAFLHSLWTVALSGPILATAWHTSFAACTPGPPPTGFPKNLSAGLAVTWSVSVATRVGQDRAAAHNVSAIFTLDSGGWPGCARADEGKRRCDVG